jgi:N-acetyl sugar amidotransferase
MDTSDPLIVFDSDGICNHCHDYDKKMIQLNSLNQDETNLNDLVQKIKKSGKGKQFDCIIGISGGVDSTYVAFLVKQLGLRPLAVHLDNGWNSELAVKNIENTVKKLEIELFTYVIDWEEFKDIQLSFLKASTPDSEVPSDHAIFAILRKLARKYGVNYILNGINSKTESHHALSWSQGHSDFGYIKGVQKLFGHRKIKTFPHGNFFTIFQDRFSSKWISILDFIDYNKDRAKEIIIRELDWKDYGGKHFESIYTKFFQGYILPNKFGYDKRKMHFSSLICAGQMAREEALIELSNPPYPLVEQEADKEYLIKKFDISINDFNEIIERPKKSYFDYPSYYGKILKSPMFTVLKRIIHILLKRN